jgi:hypothetical protein
MVKEIDKEWEPQFFKDLVLGYVLFLSNDGELCAHELVAQNVDPFNYEFQDGIEQSCNDFTDYDIKGTIPAPFPTYKVSAVMPGTSGGVEPLGFEHPGTRKPDWHHALCRRIWLNMHEEEEKEGISEEKKNFLIKCADLCEQYNKEKKEINVVNM